MHTQLTPEGEVQHGVQTDNRARAEQALRLLTHLGYPPLTEMRSARGYHAFDVWSLEDRVYNRVPPLDPRGATVASSGTDAESTFAHGTDAHGHHDVRDGTQLAYAKSGDS